MIIKMNLDDKRHFTISPGMAPTAKKTSDKSLLFIMPLGAVISSASGWFKITERTCV
jgi:hypothetical protein